MVAALTPLRKATGSERPCQTILVTGCRMGNDGAVEIRPGLVVSDRALVTFCRRHAIRRLAIFGSALRADFREDSDVDVLVEFEQRRTPGLLRLAAMELELGDLLGREVELRTYEDLSRHFRDQVQASAEELYAAA